MYHAHLDEETAAAIIRCFTQPDGVLRCLVSTIAFGMGIDVPNLTYVLHWGAPASVFEYWQEVGRSGRDNKPAHAILYSPPKSLSTKICNAEIIALVNDTTTCIRHRALNALQVHGIADDDINACCKGPRCCKACDGSFAMHK